MPRCGGRGRDCARSIRTPSDVRLPHVNDPHPDVATFMIACAVAETYRDVFDAPIPAPLVAILRQMEVEDCGCDPMQAEPHVALIVEDDPNVRALAAVLEETFSM